MWVIRFTFVALLPRKQPQVLLAKFNTLNNNNNNNNNVTFNQEGLHQMEDEMGVICSRQGKMKIYGKTQQKTLSEDKV
jgi:hypothetical protein